MVKVKGKEEAVDMDEHPRPKTTLEGLAKLPAVFKKSGVVTAGSSSVSMTKSRHACVIPASSWLTPDICFQFQGICDGAGAVILASEKAVRELGLKPLARLVAYSVVGVEPTIMGIGPAPAIQKILKISGKGLNDIDLVEVNSSHIDEGELFLRLDSRIVANCHSVKTVQGFLANTK
jgi:acetyl-CoA acyltransferase 2